MKKKTSPIKKSKNERSQTVGKRDIPLIISTKLETPFRIGSKSGDTWELIKANPNKSFNEYVGMGGRANTISGALRNEWLTKVEIE